MVDAFRVVVTRQVGVTVVVPVIVERFLREVTWRGSEQSILTLRTFPTSTARLRKTKPTVVVLGLTKPRQASLIISLAKVAIAGGTPRILHTDVVVAAVVELVLAVVEEVTIALDVMVSAAEAVDETAAEVERTGTDNVVAAVGEIPGRERLALDVEDAADVTTAAEREELALDVVEAAS